MTRHRSDRAHRFWNTFAGGYDTFMRLWRPTYGQIVTQVEPWLSADSTVLEVAAGTGLITLQVAQRVARVDAIDISPSMLNVAARKTAAQAITNVRFTVQDAYHLGAGDEIFDIILAVNVLHVLEEPARALGEAHRVLKAGGLLIAPTYCHGQNRRSRTVSLFMERFGFKAFHKWSVADFHAFVERCGFRIVEAATLKNRIPQAVVVARKVEGF